MSGLGVGTVSEPWAFALASRTIITSCQLLVLVAEDGSLLGFFFFLIKGLERLHIRIILFKIHLIYSNWYMSFYNCGKNWPVCPEMPLCASLCF